MNWPASWVCFYCSNPISEKGRSVFACVLSEHPEGKRQPREMEKRFHPACFDKFSVSGRPYNPSTIYTVIDFDEVEAEAC